MRRFSLLLFYTLLAGMLGSQWILHAQIVEQKLIASDGSADDLFGWSVSVSGDFVLTGTWSDDGGRGSAYVFRPIDGEWLEEQKLIASDRQSGDHFGESVSLSGEVAIAGAHGDDNLNGAAYVFRRINGVWIQEQKLVASDREPGDRFGSSVSIFGNIALVGAVTADGEAQGTGTAYVFRRINGEWVEEQELTASDGMLFDYFGQSVSVFGEFALIGARLDDDNGTYSGSAYVFHRIEGLWVEEQKLTAFDGASGDEFGWEVSLSDDLAIVGVYGWANSAYVFRRTNGMWTLEEKLTPRVGGGGMFGHSVSIFDDVAIVGALEDDANGNDSGSVYVFRRVDGAWTEELKLTASDGAANDKFGRSVAVSRNLVVVGATGDDDNGEFSGAVYVYDGVVIVGEEQRNEVLPPVGISPPHPNPARDQTVVEFHIPRPSDVTLRVCDILGREVGVLYNREASAGEHAVLFNTKYLAPGLYLLRLEAGSVVATQRLTVIR